MHDQAFLGSKNYMSKQQGLAVQISGVYKRFGSRLANENVSMSIKKGTVHAIVGENGAGKSTIVKILYGAQLPDQGQIAINGEPVKILNSEQAIGYGIGMVYQHFMLVEAMSVIDNILLGKPSLKNGAIINYQAARAAITSLCADYNFKFELDALVRDLDVGTRQRLEIFKTIYRESEIVILDEPTSVLTKLEVQDLFRIIKRIKQQGKTVIIITHKLDEVLEIADNITVMRGGLVVANRAIADISSIEELAGLMVGRNLVPSVFTKKAPGKVLIEVKNLTYFEDKRKLLDDISFSIRSGQILGIAGISGNGQQQLEQILAGMITTGVQGSIRYKGQEVLKHNVARLRKLQFAHIPSDRLRWGYISGWPNYKNSILGYQQRPSYNAAFSWLKFSFIKNIASRMLQQYSVSPPDVDYNTDALSGGNQQKLLVGRELESAPEFIVVCEPTQGVDIASVAFIHDKIIAAKEAGKAILLISSELSEIKQLADRSFVISAGRLVSEIDWELDDDKSIGLKMIGLTKNST